MESTEKSITENESMEIIRQMITTAKNELSEDGFLYLLWGWLVLAASLSQYFLMRINYSNSGLPWAVLMVCGGIVSAVYGIRKRKKEKVKSYVDNFMGYLWTAFGVALFIVLVFMSRLGINTFPLVMVVYGIGTFVSGGALKFRPLIIGGVACWALAFGAFFVDFDLQLLMLAASVLLSYIIPGYMLRARYSVQHVQRA